MVFIVSCLTENDACCGVGSGNNRLGQILMRVREELRHDQNEGNDPAETGLRATEPG
jgi:hypothetical protein